MQGYDNSQSSLLQDVHLAPGMRHTPARDIFWEATKQKTLTRCY
jgi:hypothetical protein